MTHLSSLMPSSLADRVRWLVPIAMGAVLAATCALYFHALDTVPVVVAVDEARFGLHGDSIATRGADLAGNRWPLFFHITDPLHQFTDSDIWWQPALFYLVAGVFRFVPPSEWSLRLPTTILAIVNVILIFLVARRLFSNGWYAIVAASVLALTPGHYLFARRAFDYFCQLPIALAWLWCLSFYTESTPAWLSLATGLLLGVGLFTHISSWIVMPGYLVATCLVLRRLGAPRRSYGSLIAGFAVPAALLVPAVIANPALPSEMFSHYQVQTGLQIAERINVYWGYLSPSYLFFSGGSNPMFATGRGGVLAVAAAILLPLGIWSVLQRRADPRRDLLVFGFFFAALPVALTLPPSPRDYTPRDLLVVPFAALLCAVGVERLFENRGRGARALGVVLLAAIPFQFSGFTQYYLTGYQTASAARFDEMNLEAVAEYIIARDDSASVPAVYLGEDVGLPHAYQWAFYLHERRRDDLWTRSRYFSFPISASAIPSGSLLVFDARDPRLDEIRSSTASSIVRVVNGVSGAPAATVLRKD
jgi:4-amino-4-deoxy-L-arabinose transferase-like glycosyltransferase